MSKSRIRQYIAVLLCVVLVLSVMTPIQSVYADGSDQTLNSDIQRDLALSYKLKGSSDFVTLTSPYEIPDGTKVDVFNAQYSFKIVDHVNPDTGEVTRTIHSGDYYLIDLPEKIQITTPTNGSILGNEGKPIANYSFVQEEDGTWQVKVEFTDYVDDANEYEIYGSMDFDFKIDLSDVEDGDNTVVTIPIDSENSINIDVTNPEPLPTEPTGLVKSVTGYNQTTRELVWNVKMSPDTGVFSGCTFHDTIDINRMTLKSIRHGLVTLVEGTDYTYDSGTGEIEYLIPEGRDGTNYQNIVITTVVKSSIYENLSPTTINNNASLTGGESFVDLDSNTASYTITPKWFGKSGTVFEGNKIKWTLDANITNQSMYNAVITDNLQADVTLDKTSVRLGNTLIAIYDDAYTPTNATEVYGVYHENEDGTATLKIYLPRGAANASTAKQTVTFVTTVKSPDSVVTADPIYNNTATLDANYIGDGGGEGTLPTINLDQVGVAVPYVSIVKGNGTITAEDKRNGTIPWTFTAASNLSDYGTTKIVDTLPSDQTFLEDEIYCGTVKLDSTTEPKATLSEDKRTLTITYSGDNALSTAQTFSAKSKIDTEVYGQNVNRNFTNSVVATIYEKDGDAVLDSDSDTHNVAIQNTVISKTPVAYNGNTTKDGQNPRINFSITVNSNLMSLQNVVVSDDLTKLVTEFKKSGESTYTTVSGMVWTYVPGSLSITKTAGARDSLNLTNIAAGAAYADNLLTVDFGQDVAVNDKYVLTFTLELDISQNSVFDQNGVIRCKGNVGDVTADGLKEGKVSSPATSNSADIKNEVLGKYGVHSVDDQQIIWTINLNQHNLGVENSKVVDILPKGLTLDPTSIKLYKNIIGTDGNFVTGNTILTQGTEVPMTYSYELSTDSATEGQYVLTVNLPDNETAYILRFATDIQSSLFGKEISNSAYYEGEIPDEDDNEASTTVVIAGPSGGGSTTKSSIKVYKNSQDDGAALDGCVVALHWLRNGDANDPVFVRNQTLTNGVTTFYGLTRGQKYTLTEVTAPEGYTIDEPNPIEFTAPLTGTATADAVYLTDTPIKTGSWMPAALKNLDGKGIIRSFAFELKEGTKTVLTGTTDQQMENGDMSVAFQLAEDIKADDVLNFTDAYTFGDDDPVGTSHLVTTRTFTMSEVDEKYAGYGYDQTVYSFVVKVYNVKGSPDLKVIVEDEDGNVLSDDAGVIKEQSIPVFHNTYRANGELVISGTKVLTGHNLEKGQFSYELYEGTTLLQTVTNLSGSATDENTYKGNFDFEAMKYSQSDVGTKTYKVVERNDGLDGYTYDEEVYLVTVEISDGDDGTLQAEVTGVAKASESGESPISIVPIAFENSYQTTDLDVGIAGTKTLIGKPLEDGQFTFVLTKTDEKGTPTGEVERVENNNGEIKFSDLHYTQADRGKTYYYQITEEDAKIPGITCDDNTYTVSVTVEDQNDGTLGAKVQYYRDGVEVDGVDFNNIYKAEASLNLTCYKTLKGKLLTKGEFEFELQQVDPLTKDLIGEPLLAKNTSDGSVFFPSVQFGEGDDGKDFLYLVHEVNQGGETITYDKAKYWIHVHVTDMGDGTLAVDSSILDEKGDAVKKMAFVNTYSEILGTTVPETGDDGLAGMISGFAILSLLGMTLIWRRGIYRASKSDIH